MSGLDMFNSAAIREALRLLVQSRAKLSSNCAASATVEVGSTELFRPATGRPSYPITGLTIAAILDDSANCPEPVTIIEISDETTLVLYAACAGTFTTANSATIALATPELTLGAAAVVTEGWNGIRLAIAENRLPTITIVEERGDMPGTRAGTNVQYDQLRLFRILYARQRATDEESERELALAVEQLCNLLMEDNDVGGTVRQAWVSGWNFRPPEDAPYDVNFDAVSVGEVQLTTIVRATWTK